MHIFVCIRLERIRSIRKLSNIFSVNFIAWNKTDFNKRLKKIFWVEELLKI